jgi:uncharacterized repeat protein (TIGR01451 family)
MEPEPAPRSGWPTRTGTDPNRNWSSMAYPTGSANTSVVGIEKGMPKVANVGQSFEYLLIVTNLTTNTLENVSVTETFGPYFDYEGSNPEGNVADGDSVTWSLGTMSPRESRTIRVTGSGSTVGTITSCATVSYASLLCMGVPVVAPDLALALAGPAEVLRCDDIVYTLTVNNPGTGAVSNVRVNQPLPSGLTTLEGRRSAEFTVDMLGPGESREFNIPVRAAEAGTFELQGIARGGGLEAESGSVQTVIRQPVLEIERDCPDVRFLGRDFTVDITVRNTGDGQARDLMIEEVIPSGAQVVQASHNGQVTGDRVVWSMASLNADASRTVSVTYRAGAVGSYRGSASAQAYCAEVVSDSCTTRIEGIPAMLLDGYDDPDPIEIGATTTYTLTVTNQGTADLTNVRLIGKMDEGDTMEFVSANGSTPAGPVTGTARGLDVNFPAVERLAPGQTATYRIVVRAKAAGQVSFRAEAVSNEITRPLIKVETTNFYE